MARKAGQIITRGASTWLVRVYLGRDMREFHSRWNDTRTCCSRFRHYGGADD